MLEPTTLRCPGCNSRLGLPADQIHSMSPRFLCGGCGATWNGQYEISPTEPPFRVYGGAYFRLVLEGTDA